MLASVDWTEVGALLTAAFTGAITLLTALAYALGRRSVKEERALHDRRQALKDLLGARLIEGTQLAEQARREHWMPRVVELLVAALGKGEAGAWIEDGSSGSRLSIRSRRAWLSF